MLYFPAQRLAVALLLNSDCGVRSNRARHAAVALAEAVVGALPADAARRH